MPKLNPYVKSFDTPAAIVIVPVRSTSLQLANVVLAVPLTDKLTPKSPILNDVFAAIGVDSPGMFNVVVNVGAPANDKTNPPTNAIDGGIPIPAAIP